MSIYSVLAVVAGAITTAAAFDETEATISGSLFVVGSLLVVASGVIGLGTQILVAMETCRKRREHEQVYASPPKAFRDMTIRPNRQIYLPEQYRKAHEQDAPYTEENYQFVV